MPRTSTPFGPQLGIWRLRLPAAGGHLMIRTGAARHGHALDVPDAVGLVGAARASLRGPLVVEIEGPGDPLASPESVFRILSLLQEHHPNIRCGLVIDGPLLGEYAEDLVDFGLAWVVLRLETATLRIARRIFSGARHRGEVLSSTEAADLYLEESARAPWIARRVHLPLAVRIPLRPRLNAHEVASLAQQAARGGASRVEVVAPDGWGEDLRGAKPNAKDLRQANRLAQEALEGEEAGRGSDLFSWLAPGRIRDVDLDALEVLELRRTLGEPLVETSPRGAHLPPRRAQVVAVASRDGSLVDLPLQKASSLHVFAVTEDSIHLLGLRSLPCDPQRFHDGVGRARDFLPALVGCGAVVARSIPPRAQTLLQAVGVLPVSAEGGLEDVLDRVARGTLRHGVLGQLGQS